MPHRTAGGFTSLWDFGSRSIGRTTWNLRITDPGWLPLRKLDDLVPDHGHLMHLFLVEWPEMDRVFHLHPDQTAPGYFATALPIGAARDVSHLWRHRA